MRGTIRSGWVLLCTNLRRRVGGSMDQALRAYRRARRSGEIVTTNLLELLSQTPGAIRLPMDTPKLVRRVIEQDKGVDRALAWLQPESSPHRN